VADSITPILAFTPTSELTPKARTGRFVAVVGSGPAGLAAAYRLNRAGHVVTVFERAHRIGGGLRDDLAARLAAEGIVLRTGVDIGVDIAADWLRDDYDAVVLAAGAIEHGSDALLARFNVRRTPSGTVWCDDRCQWTTSALGVFTAGAMRQGDSTIGEAISEGCSAAWAVDVYLMGVSDLPAPLVGPAGLSQDASAAAPAELSRTA
jgi:NADPH-dependent glutamate synthase beta subunit-like oxidoreductase